MPPPHEPGPGVPPPSAARTALPEALDRLVERATLTRAQADAVLVEVESGAGSTLPGRRRVFAEIAGYLGAAFVIGATLLYLGQEWEGLGRGGRVAILAAMALVLAASGILVRRHDQVPAARWWQERPQDDVRRRLASTLLTGAAGAASFAAYAALEPNSQLYSTAADDRAAWAASLTAMAVAALGYLLARSAVGQLGAAVAACAVLVSSLELVGLQDTAAVGTVVLLLGVLWAVLVCFRLLTERRFGLAVAVSFGLTGAQLAVVQPSTGESCLGYVLTALVAAACFTGYTRSRDWVLLAGGVVGATLVVPEVLYDLTDESFGPSGVLLAAGLTLLATSLAGLRIRRIRSTAATSG